MNFAPFFIEEPKEMTVYGQSFFEIPKYIDILGEEVFVEVEDLQPFMSFNSDLQVIEFSGQIIDGLYPVKIILTDAAG